MLFPPSDQFTQVLGDVCPEHFLSVSNLFGKNSRCENLFQLLGIFGWPLWQISLHDLVHDSHQTLTLKGMGQGHQLIQNAPYGPGKTESFFSFQQELLKPYAAL